MPRIVRLQQNSPDDPEFAFSCPGCDEGHWFKTTGDQPVWTWNRDFDKPTVSPSILVSGMRPDGRCHSFINDGKIRFLADCDHALAGQTVDLPDFDDPDDQER